ncbi:hypothetical protein ACS0TY_023830 [Phlomoides rotata]
MGRGVSSGGGQSSLGYLFGSGEAPAPKPARNNAQPPPEKPAPASHVIPEKPVSAAPPAEAPKQIPAGIQGSQKNNYYRADGQNTGNFLTVCLLSLFYYNSYFLLLCLLYLFSWYYR